MDLPEPSSPSTAINRPGKLVSANVFMSLAAESYDETRLRPIPFSWRRLLGGVGGGAVACRENPRLASLRSDRYRAVARGPMKVIVQFTSEAEEKALPILLRHSPGMVLPGRTYVLSDDALRALRRGGIQFVELSRETEAPSLEVAGERV